MVSLHELPSKFLLKYNYAIIKLFLIIIHILWVSFDGPKILIKCYLNHRL